MSLEFGGQFECFDPCVYAQSSLDNASKDYKLKF